MAEPLPDHALLAALRTAAAEGDEAAALFLANYGAQNRGGPTAEQEAEIRRAATDGHEPSRLFLLASSGDSGPWDDYVRRRLAEIGAEGQGAQNTAVDGVPDIGTGPTCTGVAGEASAPRDTDPV